MCCFCFTHVGWVYQQVLLRCWWLSAFSPLQGDVLFWHKENGLETLEAVQYIELLEGEVSRLRQQLGQLEGLHAAQQQQQLPPPLLQQPQQPGAASGQQADRRQLPVPVQGNSSSLLQQVGECTHDLLDVGC